MNIRARKNICRERLLEILKDIDDPDCAEVNAPDFADVLREAADLLADLPGQIVHPGNTRTRSDEEVDERAQVIRDIVVITIVKAILGGTAVLIGAVFLAIWAFHNPIVSASVIGVLILAFIALLARRIVRELRLLRNESRSGLWRGPTKTRWLEVGEPGEFRAELWEPGAFGSDGWLLHWQCSRCGQDRLVSMERDGDLVAKSFPTWVAVEQHAIELGQRFGWIEETCSGCGAEVSEACESTCYVGHCRDQIESLGDNVDVDHAPPCVASWPGVPPAQAVNIKIWTGDYSGSDDGSETEVSDCGEDS